MRVCKSARCRTVKSLFPVVVVGWARREAALANECPLALGPETSRQKGAFSRLHLFYATFEALFGRVVACRRVVQDELPNVVAPDVLFAVVCARWRVPPLPFTPPDPLACRTIADLAGTVGLTMRPQSCLRKQPKARCDARGSYFALQAQLHSLEYSFP
ncbi:hypothetical protein PMIN07_005683 [Paraphaeosphaeria minitans]|uniref:Uncharacterized protein n=1 Tax=Paraphaeosphaeria minitans TaxID=565426 RepID=A0A9P6GBY8_9PLEO|nr:hypothetical protein PMIN01_09171 [Paraphaeosphaeria minitans]